MELPKNYDFKQSEEKWIKYWEEEGIYKFDPNSKKPIYILNPIVDNLNIKEEILGLQPKFLNGDLTKIV